MEKSIAIDVKGTETYEQTYSYDGHHVWVHIVSLVDRFDYSLIENSTLELYIKRFLRIEKEKKNLFNNNQPEKCISVKIPDGQICCSEVYLSKELTFEQADEILLFKNDEAYLNEWMSIFYETGKSLRKNQTNSEKFTENPLMGSVISELSMFVSAKFGEYMFYDNLNGVSEIRLYVNPFKFDKGDEQTNLKNLFQEAASTSAFYSDFITTRLFTFKANNLLKIELQEPNIPNIELFKSAFLYFKNILINFDFETTDANKKIQLIKDISFLFNKNIFPQFNYFGFRINKYRPERAKYQFMGREVAKNVYNFDTNYKYYSKLSEVLKDPWNFVYIYLIYQSLSVLPDNCIENFVRKVDNAISLHKVDKAKCIKMNQYLSEDRIKHNDDEGNRFFTESLSFYSVVVEYLKDINNDFIIKLKFPTVKNFFQIPVNPALNFSKLFAKWKPKINENELKLNLLVHFTNNLSTDGSKTTQNINSENWKQTIDLMDFKLIYNLDVLNLNENLFDRLKQLKLMTNEEITNDEEPFTLNTDLSLNYTLDLDSIRSGNVLVVQVNKNNKFNNELNSFVNKDHEDYKIIKPDTVDPSTKPHIELIKFNKLIHYCFVHHSKAKSQDFIWLISNLEIEKLNEPNHFKLIVKVTEFTKMFWLNDNNKKPNKVCLSFKNSISKSFDIDYLVYADDEYINIFHGEIIGFDEMIQSYLNNKEIRELELILKFDKDFSLPIDKLVTLEIYYDDLLEEQKQKEIEQELKKQKEEQDYKERKMKADRQAEIQRKRDKEIEERNSNNSNNMGYSRAQSWSDKSNSVIKSQRSNYRQNNRNDKHKKSEEEESNWRNNNEL